MLLTLLIGVVAAKAGMRRRDHVARFRLTSDDLCCLGVEEAGKSIGHWPHLGNAELSSRRDRSMVTIGGEQFEIDTERSCLLVLIFWRRTVIGVRFNDGATGTTRRAVGWIPSI
jgi:hypothetical protein